MIMPPPHHFENLEGLSLSIAKSLVNTLYCFSECTYTIKHPNDVMVGNRKIAGILIESATFGEKIMSMVLGMGVNFCQTEKDFCDDRLYDATSLYMETGEYPDRTKFLISLLEHIRNTVDAELYVKCPVFNGCRISKNKK